MSQSEEYFTDGHHVNEKGSELKARLFSDFLISCKLLEKEVLLSLSSDCVALKTGQHEL